jgi:hypothetical protein
MSQQNPSFEAWAIVELFGHQKIAGKVTEQNIAGSNMLRVDVPETSSAPAFTRLFGSAAIYAINPVDEAIAKQYAQNHSPSPVTIYELRALIDKMQRSLPPEAFTMEEE